MVTKHASDLEGLGQRLSEAVERAGGRKAVSKEADVPLSSLDRYLRGKSEIPALTLARLANACGVSVAVFLKPFLAEGQDLQPDAIVFAGNRGTKQTVEYKQERGRGGRISDPNQISSLAISANDGEDDTGFIRIPRFEVRASAGPGVAAQASDLATQSEIAFRDTWLRALGVSPDNAQFLIADGDSMEPTIKDRDLLLVDRRIDRVVSNSIYVVAFAGHVMVKRLQLLFDGSIMLISDNERYQPERIDKTEVDRLQVEGRVRWFGRAL